MKIVILERGTVGSDVSIEILRGLGDVDVYEDSLPEEIAERVADADIVIANKRSMNRQTLEKADRLKMICQFATGYDNIDLDYCKSRGIAVANVKDYCTASVTQHTFAMALYLLEHLPYYDHFVRGGIYSAQQRFTCFDRSFCELEGKCWGIIGMGNIGRRVASAAASLGCRVIWASTSGVSRDEAFPCVAFEELLSESDIISLHCPLNEKSRHLIDAAAFSHMKKEVILLNLARGAVVDQQALADALRQDRIAAAGLDVVDGEPLRTDNPLYALLEDERLFITPHMGWAALEARTRVVEEAYRNIEAFQKGLSRNRII
ncbi:MAG: hydroxyacid dehydrogenase [Lachnospiraceae bacterium]|nr:hydroxyacid dehydrogenase [Lachnospiraceae bacterium]